MTELEDFVGPPSVYELSDERSYNLTAADEECLTLEFLINIYNREKKMLIVTSQNTHFR